MIVEGDEVEFVPTTQDRALISLDGGFTLYTTTFFINSH
jgi:hypothetical protein